MTDMTAEERAEKLVDRMSPIKARNIKINEIAASIHLAEVASRERALEEASCRIEDRAEEPGCVFADEIRALMDNPNDSLVRSASVAKRHVESWPKWKQKAMRREVGIKERDRKEWP